MCWCRPAIRTPYCGRVGCHPPVYAERYEPIASAQPADPGETLRKLDKLIAALDEIFKRLDALEIQWAEAKAKPDIVIPATEQNQ